MTATSGTIYLVPTPIGNMGDISSRAVEVLQAVDLVACEDTRQSGQLLKRLEIKKRLISYHDFNEAARASQIVDQVRRGASVAVITDGGSPGISDPAYRIVRAAIDHDLPLVALPGPCAIIPALTASGLPTDRFFFEGFLSNKSAARKKRLAALAALEHTLVFYESPHRVQKTLADMLDVLGDRPACVAREISKKFEEYVRGGLKDLAGRMKGRTVKGEIVLVVAGAAAKRKASESG